VLLLRFTIFLTHPSEEGWTEDRNKMSKSVMLFPVWLKILQYSIRFD
jgi:hypothetical protein